MSNKNERKAMIRRFEAVYEQAQARINRQRLSLTRLSAAFAEASAALFEIAEGDLDAGSQRARARRALDDCAMMIPAEGSEDETTSGNSEAEAQ